MLRTGAASMPGPRPCLKSCGPRARHSPRAPSIAGRAAPTGVFPPAFAPTAATLASDASVLYGGEAPRRLVLAACGTPFSGQSFAFDKVRAAPPPSPPPGRGVSLISLPRPLSWWALAPLALADHADH